MKTDNKYVRLTRPKIKNIFQECNSLYFNDEIELPKKFELWTCQKTCVGWVRAIWDRKARRFVTWFHISGRYRWTEDNLRKTIIHEMIHMYIRDYMVPLTFWQRIFPRKQHGRDFIEKMNELNDKFNLGIMTNATYMKKELIG